VDFALSQNKYLQNPYLWYNRSDFGLKKYGSSPKSVVKDVNRVSKT